MLVPQSPTSVVNHEESWCPRGSLVETSINDVNQWMNVGKKGGLREGLVENGNGGPTTLCFETCLEMRLLDSCCSGHKRQHPSPWPISGPKPYCKLTSSKSATWKFLLSKSNWIPTASSNVIPKLVPYLTGSSVCWMSPIHPFPEEHEVSFGCPTWRTHWWGCPMPRTRDLDWESCLG